MLSIQPYGSCVLMDIGSTIIKYFRFDDEGRITDGGYFLRDFDRMVGGRRLRYSVKSLGGSRSVIVRGFVPPPTADYVPVLLVIPNVFQPIGLRRQH